MYLLLYIVWGRYKRYYLPTIIGILFYIMFYSINAMEKIDSFIPRLYLQHKNGPDLNLPPPPPLHPHQSIICTYAPARFLIQKHLNHLIKQHQHLQNNDHWHR